MPTGNRAQAGLGDALAARADFKPAVYWFWHRLPLAGEIESQLGAIKKAGYGTVLIQPRLAFPREEYLGEAYLEAYRQALVWVRRLGLGAGLYDDYGWISGHAGGRTVRADDLLREGHLFWTTTQVEGDQARLTVSAIRSRLVEGLGPAAGEWLYEGGRPRWDDWRLISALAGVPAGNPSQAAGPVVEVTGRGGIDSASPDGCRLVFRGLKDLPAGTRLTAFVSARCASSRLINYLHPQAGEGFIRAGYEPYQKALAGFFGEPLRFLFFDQPYSGFYDWRERSGNLLNSLMYHRGLAEAYEAEHQAPLSLALGALVSPDSVESPRLRADFFETYGRLARRSFLGPVRRWARENGLAASGHELLGFVGGWGFAGGLPDLDGRTNFGADYFAVDGYKDLSAVDACNYRPQLSARFGASLAKSHGRRGCLVEQYSASPEAGSSPAGRWDLTLSELRSQSIRHLFQGASRVVFHGFYQTDGQAGDPTLLANPRLDFPPGINFEPWFGFHAAAAREQEGLASFLAGAEELVPVAVLYPLRTYWHSGPDHPFAAESAWWHRRLTETGYPFDILDEGRLMAGDPAAAARDLRQAGYQVLILPGVEIVADPSLADRLAGFVAQGGLVIASGPLPSASQATGRDPDLAGRVSALFSGSGGAVHLSSGPGSAGREEEVDRLLAEKVSRPVRFSPSGRAGARPWTWAGREKEGWRLALFNDGPEDRRMEMEVPGRALVPEIQPLDGGRPRGWGWFDRPGQATRAWVDLEPGGLACFYLRSPGPGPRQGPRLGEVAGPAGRGWADREAGGLRAGFTILQKGTSVFQVVSEKEPAVKAPASAWTVSRSAEARWTVSVAPGDLPEPVDLASGWTFRPGEGEDSRPIDVRFGWERLLPAYSGVGCYRTVFDLPPSGPDLAWELILPEVVATAGCRLNGSPIGERGWPPFIFPLPPGRLKKRGNELCLEVANTAANRYHQGLPYRARPAAASGLIGVPQLRPAVRVELAAG